MTLRSSQSPDVVIASVPWTDTQNPLMAPAVLKSSLQFHGISARALDLNAEAKAWMKNHPQKDAILKFWLSEQVQPGAKSAIMDMLDFMVDRLLQGNPKWICLSLLTYLSQIPNRWLCFRLRQRSPSTQIVIGGPGAFVSLKSTDDYARTMQRQGLIDHFVVGDGELSLARLILGDASYSGVDQNHWTQLENLDDWPWPDYSDYDWNIYEAKRLIVVGSRGCVRECTFCDIHEHWNKYQWRSGRNIFEELKYQKERYGINVFSFADALVNGNQKEYREMIRLLAEYNAKRDRSDWITWNGSFIIRPQGQMREEDWELTAASGAHLLSMGVESFVDHIRLHMKKKFTNEDLEFALEQGRKYNIGISMLVIVGYVTETEQDHQEALQWVKDHSRFAGDPVKMVQIGSGLGILPGTWLDRNKDALNIQIHDTGVMQDWTRADIDSTPEVRMRRHHEMDHCLRENGFNCYFQKDNHVLIESYLNEKYKR